MHSKFLACCLLILFVISLSTRQAFGQVDETVASVALSEARNSLLSAYEAVVEAERDGANVSGFMLRLNVAGDSLAKAEVFYRSGNFSGAAYLSDLVSNSLVGFHDEVLDVANSVVLERAQATSLTIAVSVFGVFLVVLFGFLGWGFVRDFYVRRILRMKPEVADVDER